MERKKLDKKFGKVMKVAASVIFLCAVLLCLPVVAAGCGQKEEKLGLYNIRAVFLQQEHALVCSQQVSWVNNTDNALDQVCFFVYANAFDEGQKTVSASYLARAYPDGRANFGNIQIFGVQVGGKDAAFSVSDGGNILSVDLGREVFPMEQVQIDMQYRVNLANIRHRLGWTEQATNFGNFFPIACVWENGNFVKSEFAPNGDPFYSNIANFSVTISYPNNQVLANTGICQATQNGFVGNEKIFSDFDLIFEKQQKNAEILQKNSQNNEILQKNTEASQKSEEKTIKNEEKVLKIEEKVLKNEEFSQKGMQNVQNTAEILKQLDENDFKTSLCSAQKVRDFCFVLSDKFQLKSGEISGVRVNYFYYDDEAAAKHLQTALDSVATFEDLFGEYPYAQLCVVQTGFCFGGMEYPNLVMIADDLPAADVDYVIVHEIAHQWWYGVVGNNQFEGAWVDEGLTEYSCALFYEKNAEYGLNYNDIVAGAMENYQTFVRAYKNARGHVDESMNRTLAQFETEPEYVNCTYTKGLLLFDAVRKSMSDRKFFGCLKDYYKTYAFQNSSPQKLAQCFSKSSKRNLQSFFEGWTDGKVKIGG